MDIIKLSGDATGGTLRSNSYIIIENNEFYVVDPSQTLSDLRAFLGEFCIVGEQASSPLPVLRGCIITHCHFDHIAGIVEYLERKVPLYLSEKCYLALTDGDKTLDIALSNAIKAQGVDSGLASFLTEGEYELFPGQKFDIKNTPGHTECSICIYNRAHLFCGDLLFSHGGYGRYDLPTGSLAALRASLDWVGSLDKDLTVHPGHGDDFILGDWQE